MDVLGLKDASSDLPCAEDSVDVAVITAEGREDNEVASVLSRIAPLVGEQGALLIFFSEPAVDEILPGAWRFYEARSPRLATRYTMVESHRKWNDPMGGLGRVWVRSVYDPVAHAQALNEQGRSEAAFEVLNAIPASWLEDPSVQLLSALEMQMSLLTLPVEIEPTDPTKRLYWAQQQFYRVQNLQPHFAPAHQCQAQFWNVLGRPDLARRLLRSIQHVSPDEGIARQLQSLPSRASVVEEAPTPAWMPEFQPRVLLIGHGNADCGFDALYDGLCRVLGADHVVEYPWKGFLHGEPLDGNVHHPSTCNHPGSPQWMDALERELRDGRFDVVVFNDVFELLPQEEALRLVHANEEVPVVLLDTQDEGWDNRPRMIEYLQLENTPLHFKREMLHGVDYGPRTYPLPLAYTDDRVITDISGARRSDVFWAGHRHFGMRRIALEHLERLLDRSFPPFHEPEAYARKLNRSQIGLDFFGLGFDTIRYYELPAHGCMLLAERKPIRIPHNFVEGESAVFFDDIPELEEKLLYYLQRPEEARRIAHAGHAHMKAHHTSSARARQFLGRLKRELDD
jgi:hypothetical protein